MNIGGMCCTTRIGTGRSAGRAGITRASAVGPPVEIAITTASIRPGIVRCTGGRATVARARGEQNARIRGTSCSAILDIASVGPSTSVGFRT